MGWFFSIFDFLFTGNKKMSKQQGELNRDNLSENNYLNGVTSQLLPREENIYDEIEDYEEEDYNELMEEREVLEEMDGEDIEEYWSNKYSADEFGNGDIYEENEEEFYED